MKKSKRARITPKDITRNENGEHPDWHDVNEADLALIRGGTADGPSGGGANGTDHWG